MGLPALWDHQKKAIERSQDAPDLALFWEVGTGKTRATIDIIRHRCQAHDRLLRILILAPKIVLTNWKREIAKYSRIHPRDVVVLEGSQGQRKKQLIEATNENHQLVKPRVVIANYESMTMEQLFTLLVDWNPELVVADEAHRLKNPESKRAKAVIKLADKATYRYALTGTPILNSAMDIFNIYRFLDGGETFGKNWWKFRSVWFEDENASFAGKSNYYPKHSPRPETYKKFSDLIYRKAIRAVKAECLDLPPFVRKEVFVELSPEQKRMYKEMRDDYLTYIAAAKNSSEPRAVVAQMAVTKALRLQQIVTGYGKADDGSIHKIASNPRLDALEELLATLAPDHKIIVWSIFHENYADISRVCSKLGLGFTELHGKVGQKDRDANIQRFGRDRDCRVMVANQAAGGIGINLVESDVAIFYSKAFSLEQDIQAEGRNYRGGSEQHQSVTRIDIIAPDTIDELINEALAHKQDISNTILDWGSKV